MLHIKVTKHPPTPYIENLSVGGVDTQVVVTDDLDLAAYLDYLGWQISDILPEIDPARKGRHLLNFVIPDDVTDASSVWSKYYEKKVDSPPQPSDIFKNWRKVRTHIRMFTEKQRGV